MARDPNKLIIDIEYSFRGNESLTLDARTKKEIRYRVEKRHGSDFTSAQLVYEINMWAESYIDIPIMGMDGDFDFDWRLPGGGSRRETEQFLYKLFKELPYLRPEIPGQETMFPGLATKVNP
jgi:hypothetical protein